jgi:hypothetical protein
VPEGDVRPTSRGVGPWPRFAGPRLAEGVVLGAFAIAVAVGFAWGLPGSGTWAVDSISPRSCGLGAIVETYWPGHFHTYPPLHMALLTVLSLPWIALAALRVGTGRAGLGLELIKPLYMTGIEVSARLVAGAMAIAIVYGTIRWWTRIAGRVTGIAAGAVVAANATLVYYAHTGNLEVPYLFWTAWAMVEMDRVLCGQPREGPALLCAVAAVLSKDQAVALLPPLAVALVVGPWAARGESPFRRRLVTSSLMGLSLYAVASGALVNPVGFGRRVAFLVGPASQTWAGYPRGLAGDLSLARDALRGLPHFTSWPIAVAAVAGALVVASTTRGIARIRALQPLVAGLSFTLLFAVGARRSEDRFLLPQTLLVLPYSAVVFARAWEGLPRARFAVGVLAAASLAPALLGVASLDATLLVDSRYAVERFLARLPARARVEVLGTTPFLPRLPSTLDIVRPGTEPIADRQAIPGVTELVDPEMDPRPRRPDVIVLATALSLALVTEPPPPPAQRPYGSTSYHDEVSHRLFRRLFDGSLGYRRSLVARCELPWPLECREVHDATGREVWVYSR